MTFWIGEKVFGLDVLDVQEVTPVLEITPVPGTPTTVAGVVTWRGLTIPVLDLGRSAACFEAAEIPGAVSLRAGRVVLVRRPERFGVLIDRAGGIERHEASFESNEAVQCLDPRELLDSGFGRSPA